MLYICTNLCIQTIPVKNNIKEKINLKHICNHTQIEKEMDGKNVADWDSYLINSSGKTLHFCFT